MSHARINLSTSAVIDLSKIYASGTFKNVWEGTYTNGPRQGQRCVSKQFKTGSVYEDFYFEEEMNIIRKTQKIIDDYNAAGIVDKDILLNTPSIWTFEESKHKSLIEPLIENFEKFNSNSGWAPRTGEAWGEAMQALSHFSYHDSGRQFLLCDLQGGSYSDGYILSDPVIMSQSQAFGPTDLGPDGINSFFQRHVCGRFCNKYWMKPTVIGRAVIPMSRGTSMIDPHLATRATRNPLSRLRE